MSLNKALCHSDRPRCLFIQESEKNMDTFFEYDFDDSVMFNLERSGKLFDIQMNEFSFMEKMLEETLILDLQKADLRYLSERCEIDDLGSIYLEATEETTGKKKNLICRMIDAILAFINDIIAAVENLFKKKGTVCPYAVPGMEEAIEEERKNVSHMDTVVKGLKIGAVAAAAVVGLKGLKLGIDATREVNRKDKEAQEEADILAKAIDKNIAEINRRKNLIDKMRKHNKKIRDNVRQSPARDNLDQVVSNAEDRLRPFEAERVGLVSEWKRNVGYLNTKKSKKILTEISALMKDSQSLMKNARKKIETIDPKEPDAAKKINILQRIISRASRTTKTAQQIVSASTSV